MYFLSNMNVKAAESVFVHYSVVMWISWSVDCCIALHAI